VTKTYRQRCRDLIERCQNLIERAEEATDAGSVIRLANLAAQLASEARDLDFFAEEWAEDERRKFDG
jgi:hypothetical protein